MCVAVYQEPTADEMLFEFAAGKFPNEKEMVIQTLERNNFSIHKILEENGWVAILAKNLSNIL